MREGAGGTAIQPFSAPYVTQCRCTRGPGCSGRLKKPRFTQGKQLPPQSPQGLKVSLSYASRGITDNVGDENPSRRSGGGRFSSRFLWVGGASRQEGWPRAERSRFVMAQRPEAQRMAEKAPVTAVIGVVSRQVSGGSAESADAAYLSLQQVRGAPDPLQRKGRASCQTGLARVGRSRRSM